MQLHSCKCNWGKSERFFGNKLDPKKKRNLWQAKKNEARNKISSRSSTVSVGVAAGSVHIWLFALGYWLLGYLASWLLVACRMLQAGTR